MNKKIILFTFLSFSLFSKEILLPSARPCIGKQIENRSIGYFFNADFLYYQAKNDNFQFAAKNKDSLDAKTIFLNQKWTPAFKLGFGMYVPKLTWDFYLNWTSLYEDSKNKESSIIPLFYNSSAFSNVNTPVRFNEAKANLKLYFNSLTLEVGDSFNLSKKLSLRIHGGVKGAIIKQKFKVNYENGNNIINNLSESINLLSSFTKFKSDSRGLGPRFGFNSKWNLFKSNFNLLADSSFAFLLTRLDMRYHEYDRAYNIDNLIDLLDEYRLHEYVWVLRPNGTISFGFNFGKCFEKQYLDISLKYEIDYFWEQNLLRRLVNENFNYPSKGDLFLHGLDISIHFEF